MEDTKELRGHVQAQVKIFQKERSNFTKLKTVIQATLENAGKILPVSSLVHGRVKTIDSFAEKCIRKHVKYPQPAWQLTDLCGVRVVVLSKDTIPQVRQFIESTFLISENEDTFERLEDVEFGYQSIHYIVSLDPSKKNLYQVSEKKIPASLFKSRSQKQAKTKKLPPGPVYKAEIQVKTILQHAWSSAVHDSLYKTELKKKPHHLGVCRISSNFQCRFLTG